VNGSFRADDRSVSALRGGPDAVRRGTTQPWDGAATAVAFTGARATGPVHKMSVRSAHARQCPLTHPS
jgi:hypothetical protein